MQVTKPHMSETSVCLSEPSSLGGHGAGAQRAALAGSSPPHSSGQCCPALQPADRCPGTARPALATLPLGRLLQGEPPLTVTGSCLSEELSDSLMEQWMTLSETIWISHEIRPIFTWYSLLSRPRLSGSF